ncbi:hypothetical protein TrVE_jg13320 [Triparma verrucosa]|uniref:SAM domain-containing protein n=1 Tax=Triparma verrucosa TaxID=1606542 RepID=A0A9W7CK92_9STRA|nr:hypothetical protein TrVE_jg13320 [Triparma verrucosa]
MTAAGVKLRNLQDLTIFELLDTLKSLNCPLKARKCLQTVGVNGRDFEYYTDRDLEQIGVSRPDIREKVLEIKKQILDHGSKIPETLLTPKSKWERLENKGEDPFMGVPAGGFLASNNGGLTKSNDERFTTHRASTVHTLFPSKDDTLKGISPNSPKMGSGSLTPQEKHIIKSDLVSTMEKVGEQLVRMERRSMGKESTELPVELPKL